jgi:ATP-dependent exoDNAse (exonuclease V) alpha subunit
MSVEMFNEKQKLAYDYIKAGKNVHLGGLGGCGKSFVLNVLRKEMGGNAVFLAPTGIAALNIEGATIHSTFALPMGVCNEYARNKVGKKTKELFEDSIVRTIVIDEISMVRADVFAAIDNILRLIKRKNVPFGGIQIVVVGDFGQLSPVVKSYGGEAEAFNEEFSSPYCFTTDSWSAANMTHIELTEIIRQSDATMIQHLQNIHSRVDGFRDSINYFNDNCLLNIKMKSGIDPDDIEEGSTFLTTTNRDAQAINEQAYESLEGDERTYKGKLFGGFRERPAPDYLKLKIGTKVMITGNDSTYKNGEIGYVSEMGNDFIEVMISEDVVHRVLPYRWAEYEYKRNAEGSLYMDEKASYIQFPIKHGYAITIHKSQGCTLEKAVINIPNAFAHGQTYVALSRVKTLEGITLTTKLAPTDIIFDQDVRDFYAGKFNNLLA